MLKRLTWILCCCWPRRWPARPPRPGRTTPRAWRRSSRRPRSSTATTTCRGRSASASTARSRRSTSAADTSALPVPAERHRADDRHQPPAPRWRRRAVLVGVRAGGDARTGGRAGDARADRHRAPDGRALSAGLRARLHRRRRAPHPQGRADRLPDRHRGRAPDQQFACRCCARCTRWARAT